MRVLRTFAFADLSGFTNYTAENGDDAAGRILSEFRATTRRLSSDRGVRVAKWLGDGCMIVSIEQNDVIAFSLELVRLAGAACAPLAVRIGLGTGRALLFEGDDYIGSAVNLAARLSDVAEPNEVLMPAEHAIDLPEGVSARPHKEVLLRGFPTPIAVVNLSGTPVLRGRHDTGELWTRSPFVA
jgi:adenylate cyclase